VGQALGIGQHIAVGGALIRHAAEDVIGGAVDDAAHPLDAVAAQGLFERLDDRDAATHGGLDQHIHPLLGSSGGDLFAVAGDHGLVGCHHRLTCGDGGQDQAAGRLQAAHHFHHDVHRGVVHHLQRIGAENLGWQFHRPRAVQIAHSHAFERQLAHQRMAALRVEQDLGHACSHRAKPEQADADGHAAQSVKGPILEIDGALSRWPGRWPGPASS
jgi:hypothetical protein